MSFNQPQMLDKTKDVILAELKDRAAELFSKKEDLLLGNPSATQENDSLLYGYQKELDNALDQIAVLEAEEIIEAKQKTGLESNLQEKPMTEDEASLKYETDLLSKLPIQTLKDLNEAKTNLKEEQAELERLSKLPKTKENEGLIKGSNSLIKQYSKIIDASEGAIMAVETLKNAAKLKEAKGKEAKI